MDRFFSYIRSSSDGNKQYVLFFAGDDLEAVDLVEVIKKGLASELLISEIVVICSGDNAKVANELGSFTAEMSELLEGDISFRSAEKIAFLIFDNKGRFSQVGKVAKKNEKEVEDILGFGVIELCKNKKLIVETHGGYHFAKPSGKHSGRFLKASNVIERHADRYFLALCVLHNLGGFNFDAVYVDTSGISSLVYAIGDIAGRGGGRIFVDSFSSYKGAREYGFTVGERPLVLISASTSSSLYREMKSQLPTHFSIRTLFSHIQSIGSDEIFNTLRMANLFGIDGFEEIKSYDEHECRYCELGGSVPIRLTEDQFVFEQPKVSFVMPLARHASSDGTRISKMMIESGSVGMFYDGLSGFDLDKLYFIDVNLLIENGEFKAKVSNLLKRSMPFFVNAIVYCSDVGAKEVAELASSLCMTAHGYSPRVYSLSEFAEVVKVVKEGDLHGVLVVAACSESGRSLLNVSRSIRRLGDVPVSYFVCVAKTASGVALAKIRNDLCFANGSYGAHTFYNVESIVLPVAEGGQNAWKRELDFLKGIIDSSIVDGRPDARPIISGRIDFLEGKRSDGLKGTREGIFWPTKDDKGLVLRKGFAFWGKELNQTEHADQVAVFFAVSNVLQRMRYEGERPLGGGYTVKRLDPLLFDRFNDGIIQACFLRAARASELDYSHDGEASRKIADMLVSMISDPRVDAAEGLTEFLVALCTGVLRISKSAMKMVLGRTRASGLSSMDLLLLEYLGLDDAGKSAVPAF